MRLIGVDPGISRRERCRLDPLETDFRAELFTARPGADGHGAESAIRPKSLRA